MAGGEGLVQTFTLSAMGGSAACSPSAGSTVSHALATRRSRTSRCEGKAEGRG